MAGLVVDDSILGAIHSRLCIALGSLLASRAPWERGASSSQAADGGERVEAVGLRFGARFRRCGSDLVGRSWAGVLDGAVVLRRRPEGRRGWRRSLHCTCRLTVAAATADNLSAG